MPTTTISPETLLAQLHWRAATKKFDPTRKISDATWNALEHALVLSPSSCGLQPWKFLVVKDPAVRATLRTHAWNQSQITDACHLVVLARRLETTPSDVDRLIDRIAEVRCVPRESLESYRGMMLGTIAGKDAAQLSDWNARQVYIALGGFLTACAMLGVDACPMEGFDAAKFDEVLGLRQHGYAATVVATAGYRASDDPYSKSPKVRFKPEEMITNV